MAGYGPVPGLVTSMEAQISQILVYLIGVAIVGLVAALAKLWHDFYAHKLHVAEQYMNSQDAEEIKQDLRALRDVVYRVANKLEVPVFSEPYRR